MRPQKAGKRRFLDGIHRWEECREDHHAYRRFAQSCDRERRCDDCLGKKGACFIGLRGAELLMIRPAAVVMGAAVFMIGVLSGAGIAAWMMPPV
jgi:hypothetical protein